MYREGKRTHSHGGGLRRSDGGSGGGNRGREGCRWKAGEEWSVLALADRGNRTPAGPDDNGKKGTKAMVKGEDGDVAIGKG